MYFLIGLSMKLSLSGREAKPSINEGTQKSMKHDWIRAKYIMSSAQKKHT